MKSINILKIKELFGVDIRSLALFRICIGLLVIGDIIFRFQDPVAFYTDEGVLPRNVHIEQYDSWYSSLYLINGLPIISKILLLLTIFFALLFLIGLCTRFTNIILWILVSSLHTRNPLILTGGDTLLHLLLFWSIFLPLGAKFSMDSLFRSKSDLQKSFFSLGSVALLLQLAFVYSFTAINKICPEWLNGEAIYYALNIDQYVTPLGTQLLKFPSVIKVLSYFVFYFELFGPFLLFIPGKLRLIPIFLFFCLQAGFGLSLSVGIFPFSTSIAIIPFLPSVFWDNISNKFNFSFFENLKSFLLRNNFLNTVHKSFILEPFIFDRHWLTNFLVSFFLLLAFTFNLQSVKSINFKMSEWLQRIGFFFSLDQRWYMFGPVTLKDDYWYVFQGTLKNEERIDLFKNTKKISFKKPKYASTLYKNHRWRTYIRSLWVSDNSRLYPYYGNYLCTLWNKDHTEDKKLKEIEFLYTREITPPRGKKPNPESGLIYKYTCQ